ncbi:hypothetical protein BGW42_008170 [Actinomortierella wolfii]|nr:hypothetical protein BGW42_008170 [Actinomortierella wolfii]
MLIKSTLVFALATVALARDAVLSRGIFVGTDTTSKGASKLDIFKRPENHATAVASVIRHASETMSFLPYQSKPAELCERFDAWKDKLMKFPGFEMLRKPKPVDVDMEGGEQKLAKALKRGLGKLQVVGADKIAMEFINLIPEKNEDRSLKDFLLSVIVIDKPMGSQDVAVRLVELHMELETSLVNKKVSIPDQTIRLKLLEMEARTSFLVDNAERLAEYLPRSDVAEFMWMLTSPREQDEFQMWSDDQLAIYRHRYSRLFEWDRM